MKPIALILAATLLLAGCAHRANPPSPTTLPATAPALDDRARLSIEQIQPVAALPAPATRPSTRPSVKALVLYAQAVGDLLDHHPYPAIEALGSALKLDPDRADLYNALGRAQLERLQIPNDKAFAAFERAAALRPDDLQIHLLLGRQYLAVGNDEKALQQLRLARQTSDYRDNAPGSAAVELFLGRDLEQQGYFRAALEQYLLLSRRLANPTRDLRADVDLAFLAKAPQLLALQIGQLYEKLGQYGDALASYEPLAQADPANFGLQVKVVQMLLRLGRTDEAIRQAADVVEMFRSSDSLALLHETCQNVAPDRELQVLQQLRQQNPEDRGILFALADALVRQGRADAARQLLLDAAAAHRDDDQIVRKLFDFYSSRGDVSAAAELLITRLAAQSDSVSDVNAMFAELIRPMRTGALRLSQLQKLQVPASAQAAKLFLVAEVADLWHRDALAHWSIEQAVQRTPPLAPAFRRRVDDLWSRPDLGAGQKIAACEDLAASAQRGGADSLAAEVRGLSLTYQQRYPEAADALAQSIHLGGLSPDLQLTYAAVLGQENQLLQCEQALWKLVAQWPRFDRAWISLHNFYQNTNRPNDALNVLSQWLRADPASPEARILEAKWAAIRGQPQWAEQRLAKLLQDHSDDQGVILKIEYLFHELGGDEPFVALLLQLRQNQPTNLNVVSLLVQIYGQNHRLADAVHLLDETRRAVGSDADLLYQLSSLYHEVGQRQSCEDVLGQVLQVDPGNPAASNDLGYNWADAGTHLDRAEQLIRVAVEAEPDNRAFLDSLGWVLYKRGRFDEAAKYFQEAIGPAAWPDPEILDHFGDDLYRMGRAADAQAQWARALQRLPEQLPPDSDAALLRAGVQKKLQQIGAGKAVDVAPIAASAGPSTAPAK